MEKVDDLLKYYRSEILVGGDGGFSISFKGTLNEEPVVVNRTLRLNIVEEIQSSYRDLSRIRHPNVAHLLHVTTDEDFMYDAVELGAASLNNIFLKNDDRKYKGPMPTDEQVLLQLAKGLDYLHSENILHGDIKPENILISSTSPVQMKWTGFGFRQSSLIESLSVNTSGIRIEPRKWWPPERYTKDHTKLSKKGEIFSAGCVFLYFLSGGLHPFASVDGSISENNVKEGRPINLKGPKNLDLAQTHFDFVKQMINHIPEKRIFLRDVITRINRLENQHSDLNFSSLGYVEIGICGLFVSKDEERIVKRIPKSYCPKIAKLTKLNHSNIVRLLNCYEDSLYKYFRMEFCSASLDHLFLSDGSPNYMNPKPSHEQVFIQLVSGLVYIHENGLVHGAIKPSNVMIHASKEPQIKLTDFGLIEQPAACKSSSAVLISGFQSDHYWMAPELFKDIKPQYDSPKPTRKSDIYSTGKVFFYYFFQSYADLKSLKMSNEIAPNMLSEGNTENVFKKLPMMGYYINENPIRNRKESLKSPIQLINEMTKEDPENRLQLSKVFECVKSFQLTSKGELEKLTNEIQFQFSREYILGVGNYGQVHLGFWKGSIAAVKRITISPKMKIVIEREKKLELLDHRNIVEYYGSDENLDFMHIAMEKCLTSLDDYCKQLQLYLGVIPMPPDKQVLLQMAEGLEYIHSQNLIHRDVKPGNILISADNPAVIKWTDFGVSKEVVHSDVTWRWSARQGTKTWMAPEVANVEDEEVIAGEKSDIFSLGCVYFFFLTPKIHPFGNSSSEIRSNIKSQMEPTNITALSDDHFAFNIIKEMIKLNPLSRTTISKVIKELSNT